MADTPPIQPALSADIEALEQLAAKFEQETQVFLGFKNAPRAEMLRRVIGTLQVSREQVLTLLEDAALLRAERDEALAKLAGFTAADGKLLRRLDDKCEVTSEKGGFLDVRLARAEIARLRSLALRIQALLPPPPSSKRDE